MLDYGDPFSSSLLTLANDLHILHVFQTERRSEGEMGLFVVVDDMKQHSKKLIIRKRKFFSSDISHESSLYFSLNKKG